MVVFGPIRSYAFSVAGWLYSKNEPCTKMFT